MIHVCCVPEGKDYMYLRQVAKMLRNKGIEFLFVARTKDLFRQCKRDSFDVDFISRVWASNGVFRDRYLKELDRKYGPPAINLACKYDVYLGRWSFKTHREKQYVIARAYQYWENLFRERNIDYLLLADMSFFSSRTAFNIALRLRRPSVGILMHGPGEDYFALCDMGGEYCWSELIHALKEGPKILNDEQRALALAYIQKRLFNSQEASEMFLLTMQDPILTRLRSFVFTLKEDIRTYLRKDPLGAVIERNANARLLRQTWYKYITRHLFSYDQPRHERYVYFPMFYEKEAFTLANFHYWSVNQDSLLREIAEHLPIGMKLYVKEHPGTPGELSLRRLRKIQKIKNVRVLHPLTDRHTVLDNCEAVVVLNGTSGWEAYLKRKPVVVLDPTIYFGRSRLIYKAENPCKISEVLFRAIHKGSEIYKENEEEWLWFIYTVITTCGKGKCMGSVGGIISENAENKEENYRNIADYLENKIKRALSLK